MNFSVIKTFFIVSPLILTAVVTAGFRTYSENAESLHQMVRETNGTCGSNVTWMYDENRHTLTISGTGSMSNYLKTSEIPWYQFHSSIETVIFEGNITQIGYSAFQDFTNLSNITIPYGVTSIGQLAFKHCSSLSSIIIPSSVLSIGGEVFSDCDKLTTITIPSSVTTLSSSCFADCDNLESINVDIDNPKFKSIDGVLFDKNGVSLVRYPCGKGSVYTIPDNTSSVNSYSFSACNELISVSIPYGVQTIKSYTFRQCYKLNNVTIPSTVTKIEGNAFANCYGLESVSLPSSLKIIDDCAFQCCYGLKSLIIPYGVTKIGQYAFGTCKSLTSVTIPSSVTSIGSTAFANCYELRNFTYYGTTSPESGNGIFNNCINLKNWCVPINYNSTTFCGKHVYANSSSFDYLREQHNNCNEAFVCNETYGYVEKRNNASEWESQTTECVEYRCDGSSGGVSWYSCNSSDGVNRVCMDDKCIKEETFNSREGVVIEIGVEDMNTSDIDIDELVEIFSNVTGIDKEQLKIGTETNEHGELLHIFIEVEDETTARIIVDILNSIEKGEACNQSATIICRTRATRVLDKKLYISESSRKIIDRTTMIILEVLLLLLLGKR